MNKFMKIAIDEAREGICHNDGGPFGSCVVRDGAVVASGHNHVLKNNDPTCHGEIDAIRKACAKLDTFDLTNCELYTTGEPCSMCLAACMWANIEKIYYGCTLKDNKMIGFRDKKFDEKFGGRRKFKKYLKKVDRKECLKLFEEYKKLNAKKY